MKLFFCGLLVNPKLLIHPQWRFYTSTSVGYSCCTLHKVISIFGTRLFLNSRAVFRLSSGCFDNWLRRKVVPPISDINAMINATVWNSTFLVTAASKIVGSSRRCLNKLLEVRRTKCLLPCEQRRLGLLWPLLHESIGMEVATRNIEKKSGVSK